VQAEQRDVVAGVADHRELSVRHGGQDAAQEPGAADAAGEQRDSHAPSLPVEIRALTAGDRAGDHLGPQDFAADFPVITGKQAGFITYLP
jgi:hypothetical protein